MAETQAPPEEQGAYQSLELPAWEQVAPHFQEQFPSHDQGAIRARWEQQRSLSRERERYRFAEETAEGFIGRRVVPYGSAATQAARTAAYGNAHRRFEAGKPEADDYGLIAAYERQQQLDAQQGLAGHLLHIPAIVLEGMGAGRMLGRAGIMGAQAGEMALGAATRSGLSRAAQYTGQAALTAVHMPSMWMPEWTEDNVAHRRDPYDLRGLPRAVGLGTMQTMVFGSLSRIANDIPGREIGDYLRRGAIRTGYGLGEQQGIDILSGVLTQASDRPTGYGVLGDLIQGRSGDALKHLATQAVTFAAFSALHERSHQPITQSFADGLKELRGRGFSRDTAAAEMARVQDAVDRAYKANPDLTRDQAREVVESLGLSEGAVRQHGMSLAEGLPFGQQVHPTERFRSDEAVLDQMQAQPHVREEFRRLDAEVGREAALRYLQEEMVNPSQAPSKGELARRQPERRSVTAEPVEEATPYTPPARQLESAPTRQLTAPTESPPAPEHPVQAAARRLQEAEAVHREAARGHLEADNAAPTAISALRRKGMSEARARETVEAGVKVAAERSQQTQADLLRAREELHSLMAAGRQPPAPPVPQLEPTPVATGIPGGKERRRGVRPPQAMWEAIKKDHPDWSTEQIGREAARRLDAMNVDAVTGFRAAVSGTARTDAAQEAINHTRATGEPTHYVEIDLRNLGGLNAHLGHQGSDQVFRQFADIIREEMHKSGADVQLFRHGGDEMSAVVLHGSREQIEGAMTAAQVRIDTLSGQLNLHEIPHPKSKPEAPKPPGVGIYFGIAEMTGKDKPSDAFHAAGVALEAKKVTPHVERTAPEAAGPVQPPGQAPGTPGRTEPATPAAAAGPPPGEGTAPTPTRPQAVVESTPPMPPRVESILSRHAAGESVDAYEATAAVQDLVASHGLTSAQQTILMRRLLDPTLTLEALGAERGVTREAIRQQEAKALAKLGLPGNSIQKIVRARAKMDMEARATENGAATPAAELHGDPTTGKAVIESRQQKWDRLEKHLNGLTDQITQGRAEGTLTSEQEQALVTRYSRVAEAIESGNLRQAFEAAGLSRKTAKPRTGGEASVRPAPVEPVPEGRPAAEVPPARPGGPEDVAAQTSAGTGPAPGPAEAGRSADALATPERGPARRNLVDLEAAIRKAGFPRATVEAMKSSIRNKGLEEALKGALFGHPAAQEFARQYAETLGVRGESPEVRQFAEQTMAQENNLIRQHNEMLTAARSALEEFGGHAEIVKDRAAGRLDAAQVRGFDDVAETIANRFPGQLPGGADQLFDLLQAGNRRLLGREEAIAYAHEHLDLQKEAERAQAEALQSGLTAQAAAEALQRGREAGEAEGQAAAGREPARDVGDEPPEPPGGVGSSRASSGNLAEPGEPPFRSEQRRTGLTDHLADGFSRFLADEGGYFSPGEFADSAQQLWGKIRKSVSSLGMGLKELAGRMAPRTTAASQAAGEAISRFNAAAGYAREAAPLYVDRILGRDSTQADRELAGAVLTERRLQFMRQAYQQRAVQASQEAAAARTAGDKEGASAAARRATEAMQAAGEVQTVIGKPDSPLADQAAYQQALQSPRVQQAMENWKKEMVPIMEEAFKRAEGMDDIDPIRSFTQIPGEPINLKPIRGEETTAGKVVYTTGSRGNLANLKLGKLGFARQAKGSAEGYDIDLGSIIEHSLSRSLTLAAKHEMMRTLEAEGLARWGVPGARIEMDGEAARAVPFVKPPRGTQEAQPGQDTLYVDHRAYDEVRRSLAVDEPNRFEHLATVNGLLTKASLASTVEAAYHSKNLLTFLFKPGVSLIDFFKNTYRVMTDAPGVKESLTELARIGALKEGSHLESGMLWGGKTDPTAWMGKFLDVLQRAMRLTGDQAFDRLERSGRVEGGETNRRDFINQLGQYNRRAQHKAVALLRDTGLGPFATAGTNYYMQSLMGLVAAPGVKATSLGHAAGLRAEMLAKMVGVLSVAPLMNYFLSGNVNGDDNTPFGAVRLGQSAEGRTSYVDLTNLVGLTRGARQTGLLDVIQGVNRGATPGQIADRSTNSIIHSLLHPAVGPPVQFAYTAATGHNALGRLVAEKPGEGGSQAWNNLVAALRNANPVVGALSGAEHPGRRDVPIEERASRLAGPYGPRFRSAVDRFNEQYYALSGQRQQFQEGRRRGLAFPREAEWRQMDAHHRAMMRLEHAIQGQSSVGGRIRQGERPGEERIRELRQRQVELATQALAAGR